MDLFNRKKQSLSQSFKKEQIPALKKKEQIPLIARIPLKPDVLTLNQSYSHSRDISLQKIIDKVSDDVDLNSIKIKRKKKTDEKKEGLSGVISKESKIAQN